jgi:hypothetical protein
VQKKLILTSVCAKKAGKKKSASPVCNRLQKNLFLFLCYLTTFSDTRQSSVIKGTDKVVKQKGETATSSGNKPLCLNDLFHTSQEYDTPLNVNVHGRSKYSSDFIICCIHHRNMEPTRCIRVDVYSVESFGGIIYDILQGIYMLLTMNESTFIH